MKSERNRAIAFFVVAAIMLGAVSAVFAARFGFLPFGEKAAEVTTISEAEKTEVAESGQTVIIKAVTAASSPLPSTPEAQEARKEYGEKYGKKPLANMSGDERAESLELLNKAMPDISGIIDFSDSRRGELSKINTLLSIYNTRVEIEKRGYSVSDVKITKDSFTTMPELFGVQPGALTVTFEGRDPLVPSTPLWAYKKGDEAEGQNPAWKVGSSSFSNYISDLGLNGQSSQ